MKDLIEQITKLTDEWYTLIGKDHHKDRDCHWCIETTWSYGNSPEYNISHHGYILGERSENWKTYELALERLKEILTKEIKDYAKDINNDETEW